ncbi:MAG: hypothetical protein JW794_06640 [Candidatus Cloacimonetes bacterium]|nr:hypothetical protein [Candidatus Cloacimonadota bacterium]
MKNICDPWHPDYDFVDEVEPIKLSYPHAVFTGSFKQGISSYSLSFRNVSSFLGHICLCGAGGYRITQLALEYINTDHTPLEKDRFTLISSKDNTISDVIAFILGCPRRNDSQKNQYFIDETIETKRREYIYRIEYHPLKKAVQILYRKHLLVGNEYMDELWEIEKALDKKPESVSKKDKIIYRTAMIKMVRNVLFDEVPGLFEVKEISYT